MVPELSKRPKSSFAAGDGGRTEFVTITLWESLGAMRGFTGENGEPPLSAEDARFLIGGAPAVVHYETIDPPG